jgi:hypothetical protein
MRKHLRTRKHLQDWERQAICDAYKSGEKLEAIAAEFGVTVGAVSMAGKRAGMPRRFSRKRAENNRSEPAPNSTVIVR